MDPFSHHAAQAAHRRLADAADTYDLDAFWLMFGGVLVFLMQAGFAMLEVGTISKKNTRNILLKNVLDASIGAVFWWLIGFGVAFSQSESGFPNFIGGANSPKKYLMYGLNEANFMHGGGTGDMNGVNSFGGTYASYAAWFFQWAFAATTATIVSGAVAERCTFTAYMTYSICLISFIYPVVVHAGWAWDGIWSAWRTEHLLFKCGVIDFAGSGVVHMSGGIAAMIGAKVLGARQIRLDPDGHLKPLPADYCPAYGPIFQTLGVIILWFGWFGFNGASTLYIVNGYGMIAAKTMCTTAIAAGSGALSTMFLESLLSGKPEGKGYQVKLEMANNGVLAGLVAITAGCSTVEPYGAFIIGVLAGPVFLFGNVCMEMLVIDDVVSAAPVHLFCGAFGVIATAFFATKQNYESAYYDDRDAKCWGVLYGGDGRALASAFTFVLFIVGWVGSCSYIVFKTLDVLQILRVDESVEKDGMDTSEHGMQMVSTKDGEFESELGP